jgi:hypothetical protein
MGEPFLIIVEGKSYWVYPEYWEDETTEDFIF